MLDLQRLRVLREVAMRGSFAAAASSLRFTTSAVSQQIAQLEREVGAQLVERRSTGAVLTPAGDVLLRHAEDILARVSQAEAELRAFVDGDGHTIRCGVFSSASQTLMPEAIAGLRELLPDVRITLVEQDRRETLDGIRRNELDLGVVARSGAGPDPLGGNGIERIPLFEGSVDVVMTAKHRLADAPTVALAELADETWAECNSHPARRYLTAIGAKPRIAFEGDGAALTRYVADGGAICLLPQLGQRELPAGVIVKPIAPDPPTRRVEVAVRAGDDRVSVRTFVGVIRRVADAWRRGLYS